ncbi:MAG: DNA-directed RNA polymerase subunit omega [Acidobacteriota bacterium]
MLKILYNKYVFMEGNVDQANSIDSKFRFAIIVARRAKQLINGAKPMVDVEAQNPLTIAIEEVKQGLVTAELLDDINIYLREASQLEESSDAEEVDETDMELPVENKETGIELVEEKIVEPEAVETDKKSPSEEKE